MPRLPGLILLVVLVPNLLLAQSSRSRKKPMPGTAQECAKLRSMSEVVGKLAGIDVASSTGKILTLHVPYAYPVTKSNRSAIPNPGYLPYMPSGTRQLSYQSQLLSLEQQYQKALKTKNPAQREQKLALIAQKMQLLKAKAALHDTQQELVLQQRITAQANRLFGPITRKTSYVAIGYKEFSIEPQDTLIVRRQHPPVEFDKEGASKKRTRAELDRLKGKDKTLPGYEAALQDLQSGQIIKVHLTQPKADKNDKEKAAPPEEKRALAKNGLAQKAETVRKTSLPQTRMVVILLDPDE